MTPPQAEELVPRLFLGPALRAQSDRRLVGLVRDGYEPAFDEIMRRYGTPLRRYAGAIVGARAEDVTQDAFSKALQALRRDEREIELRPWLYRIVRNTALNDLRDRPPNALALVEAMEGNRGVAEEVERREEIAELIDRLRALPEPQRAAIVMRELEGLGHDEIAAALGISGGAARQAIHRARTALRDGLGMAIPLPLLRTMMDSGAAPTEIAVGGAGAGVALKAATATVLVAGTFGAGVALHDGGSGQHGHGQDGAPADRHGRSIAGSVASASSSGVGSHRGPNGSNASGSGEGSDSGQRSSGERNQTRDGGRGSRDVSGEGGSGGRSDGGSHHSSPAAPELSGHDGKGSGGDARTDGGQSGEGSLSSGDGSGGGGSGSGDLSGSSDGLESNSGPDSGSDGSGGGESLSSSSGDSGDSLSGDGFSSETQLQP
jgi:RNA polymerase sigma factor (sigma-70 family)